MLLSQHTIYSCRGPSYGGNRWGWVAAHSILSSKNFSSLPHAQNWQDSVLAIFDPLAATVEMKERLIANGNGFDLLRKKYLERYEFEFIELVDVNLLEEDKLLLQRLGIQMSS